jgi:serine/tyrosine/threonine adenylyltransferase
MASSSNGGPMNRDREGPRIAPFVHTYAALPEHFFARIEPTAVGAPRLIAINRPLAADLRVDVGVHTPEMLATIFAGNVIPQGAAPIAMAYAGHQFGHFVPQLGDGRAILLGEVRDQSGQLRDIQLKGAGRTPFSRDGDGRAALGPVLREYLIGEAMHALGIPATRALAAVTSGERIPREGMVPGAVLTRVAASHVRVGTFQYFAARDDTDSVRQLANYVIDRHFPDARAADRPYLALLKVVTERQARLIAGWMHVGFIHGVMNTDNMAVSGETIDFGPCAFMDGYDPVAVFSSIDRHGRYAYGNQPAAAQWNLARLAETLLPLLDPDPERAIEVATEVVSGFSTSFDAHWLAGMRTKLGLLTAEADDLELIHEFLELMQASQADFTLSFRRLCRAARSPNDDASLRELFASPLAIEAWGARWRSRLVREAREPEVRVAAMRRVNPAYIPRNHRIEQAIVAAVEHDDFSVFLALLEVLSRPYTESETTAAYGDPPKPAERVTRTFCGT